MYNIICISSGASACTRHRGSLVFKILFSIFSVKSLSSACDFNTQKRAKTRRDARLFFNLFVYPPPAISTPKNVQKQDRMLALFQPLSYAVRGGKSIKNRSNMISKITSFCASIFDRFLIENALQNGAPKRSGACYSDWRFGCFV